MENKEQTVGEKLQEKLARYEEYEEYRESLRQRLDEQEQILKTLAEEITRIRRKVSRRLEKEIVKALKELNFLQVQFEIAVRPLGHMNRYGQDEVEFMLSTNPGMDMKPIGEAASGGELSRIMLAVKAVLAQHDEIPTLIFDEIDVGISGRTAQMVAEKMSYIGNTHQVICISHLAQIAAMADASYHKSLFHIERYQMHVMAKGWELLHTYDALLAEEKDAANRQKLMQQANNAIAEMLKKETQDTLDKVLFELSSQMKNAYSRSDA